MTVPSRVFTYNPPTKRSKYTVYGKVILVTYPIDIDRHSLQIGYTSDISHRYR